MKTLLLIFVSSLAAGCSVSAPSNISSDGSNYPLKKQDPRPNVSVLDLDETGFRISGLVVGTQVYGKSTSPVVQFQIPADADYLEMLRCPQDVELGLTAEQLSVGSGSTSLDNDLLRKKDLWKTATLNSREGCELAFSGFQTTNYIDDWAKTGEFRYLVRACVDPSRISDKDLAGTVQCSKLVAVSVPFSVTNLRELKENQALADAQKSRAQIESYGRSVYFLTVQMNNELIGCQEADLARKARLERKKAITQVLGTGLSLGSSLINLDPSSTSTFSDKVKETWRKKDKPDALGTQLGAAIGDLFASPNDYERSCTAAEETRQKIEIVSKQLKSEHEIWALKMDSAAAARAANVAIENK